MHYSRRDQALLHSARALLEVLGAFLRTGIDLERTSRVFWALSDSGVRVPQCIQEPLRARLIEEQREDGGWTGPFDSMWNLTALRHLGMAQSPAMEKGLDFMRRSRNEDGGWGRCLRDVSRIPVTGAILWLVPELRSKEAFDWLEFEWRREWNRDGGGPSLTYKGAFTLLAFCGSGIAASDDRLLSDTRSWLASEQDPSGGFGPWKGHPIGTLPSITGPCAEALCIGPVDGSLRESLLGIEKHLVETQLPAGVWRDHFIDVGSAYAHHALQKLSQINIGFNQ